jgi:uncharacterized pyridoxal phosphate-containing UPF0001 family protein
LDEGELNLMMSQFDDLKINNINVCGLMGMASFSEDMNLVRNEFQYLKSLFDKANVQSSMLDVQLTTLSMGMSSDYKIAVEEGGTMVRIGSLLFGARNYVK